MSELHRKWKKDPSYRKAYDALDEAFTIAGAIIEARERAGLTQVELAVRMQTSQSAVARMESGRSLPSGSTLQRLARATHSRLRISFEPDKGRRTRSKSA